MADLPKSFAETRIRDAAQWFLTNRRGLLSRTVANYRQKHILSRSAGIKPFVHFVALVIVVNYFIQYPRAKGEYRGDFYNVYVLPVCFNLAHERRREFH